MRYVMPRQIGKDCIEMKVSEDVFGYSEAIKSCLRMNPKWIMTLRGTVKGGKISSCRSWSTGVRGMTTLHTMMRAIYRTEYSIC